MEKKKEIKGPINNKLILIALIIGTLIYLFIDLIVNEPGLLEPLSSWSKPNSLLFIPFIIFVGDLLKGLFMLFNLHLFTQETWNFKRKYKYN